jgi:hypothetical protein
MMNTKESYAEKLKDPRWQKKKSRIMERDNFTCQLCSDTETTLNVHHLKYDPSGNPWDVEDEFLVTYCYPCHRVVENCKASKRFTTKKVAKCTHPGAIMIIAIADCGDTSCVLLFELVAGENDIRFLCIIPEDCLSVAHKLFYNK